MLTRAQILEAKDIVEEIVSVPEWGGDVLVRGMTGNQRDEFEASIVEFKGKDRQVHLQQIRAKLCALTMVDENGKRLFTSEDVTLLGKKSSVALQRVVEVAQRLSGLTDNEVDDLVKNSESDLNEGSGSDSL